MKKVATAGIIVVAVVIVSIALFLFSTQSAVNNQPVPLSYNGGLMDVTSSDGDWTQIPHNYGVTLGFNTTGVLYNGKVTLSYLATNGSWIQLPTRDLGTVDSLAGDTGFTFMTENCQYVSGTKCAAPFYFTNTDDLKVIRIEAFGYRTP